MYELVNLEDTEMFRSSDKKIKLAFFSMYNLVTAIELNQVRSITYIDF